MVKLEIDTNTDSLDELEEAQKILAQALARRSGETQSAQELVAQADADEATIDTPFFKLTVRSEEEARHPTVNELLEEESLTEDELNDLFKHVVTEEHKERKKEGDSYIEIVDFEDKSD